MTDMVTSGYHLAFSSHILQPLLCFLAKEIFPKCHFHCAMPCLALESNRRQALINQINFLLSLALKVFHNLVPNMWSKHTNPSSEPNKSPSTCQIGLIAPYVFLLLSCLERKGKSHITRHRNFTEVHWPEMAVHYRYMLVEVSPPICPVAHSSSGYICWIVVCPAHAVHSSLRPHLFSLCLVSGVALHLVRPLWFFHNTVIPLLHWGAVNMLCSWLMFGPKWLI